MQNFDTPIRPPNVKTVFVTVGTTEFDSLISAVTQPQILTLLSRLGYQKLLLQIGRGSESFLTGASIAQSPVHVEFFRFKPDIKEDIVQSSLVIGHAGAGTCLEVLELNKRLLVVVNEKLHDNHQLELARRLKIDGHLEFCFADQLNSVLSNPNLLDNLRPFPKGDPSLFADWLDDYL